MELISHLLICHFVCLHLILPRGIGRFLSLEKKLLNTNQQFGCSKNLFTKKHIITKTQVTWISSVHLLRLSITFRLSSQLSDTVVLHWKSHLRDVLALKIQVFPKFRVCISRMICHCHHFARCLWVGAVLKLLGDSELVKAELYWSLHLISNSFFNCPLAITINSFPKDSAVSWKLVTVKDDKSTWYWLVRLKWINLPPNNLFLWCRIFSAMANIRYQTIHYNLGS